LSALCAGKSERTDPATDLIGVVGTGRGGPEDVAADTGLRIDACRFHHIEKNVRIFVDMPDEPDLSSAVERIRHYFHVRSLPEVVFRVPVRE
jgi:hypothetical protein